MKLKEKAVALSRGEIYNQAMANNRLTDYRHDKQFCNAATCSFGNILYPQPVYFNIYREFPNNKYTYNTTTVQISKMRYDTHKDMFFGIEKTDKNNRAEKVVPLETSWVEETWKNQPHAIHQIIQKAIDGKTCFIEVPIGDPVELKPTMDITGNPLIRYPQGDEHTCVYSSLASAMFILNYTDEARAVIEYGNSFLNDEKSPMDKIMPSLIQHIRTDATFAYFRKGYRITRKIGRDYNILEESEKTF